ncbi:MAG TPA: type II toxin-antitoxin system VapC family toxin [Thermomicrobiales bacterium]|nr:type II toxin-antitoxin system VapC family toxin [Thermomicrobiales bacterium]
MTVVLDTNVVLYLLGNSLAKPLPGGPYSVSVITEMELLSYPSLTDIEEQRIRDLLASVAIIELSLEIREAAIRIRREHRLKLPDAIIAGTAIATNLELLTNDRRFARVPDLRCHVVEVSGH